MKQERVNKTFVFATIGMLCAISTAATAVAYPKVARVIKVRDGIAAAEREFELCKKAASSVDAYYETEMPVISASLAKYDAKLPAAERLPELLADVKRACRAAGIAGVSISTQRATPNKLRDSRLSRCAAGVLHKVPLSVTGTSTYRGVAALLNNLAAGPRLVLTNSIIIKQADQRSGLISFRAQVEGYCFLETDRRR